MKLLTLWLRCVGLVLFVPLVVIAIPAVAVLDSVREGGAPMWRCRHYYQQLSRLEVRIEL